IGEVRRKGIDTQSLERDVDEVKEEIRKGEEEEKNLEWQIEELLLRLPNLPAPITPDGSGPDENLVVRYSGSPNQPNYPIQDHLDFGEKIGMLDFSRGSKIAGSGFPLWMGWGARLERALINFLLDIHINEHHYREVMTPFVANRESMQTTGQVPILEEDMYYVEKDDLFLIPTSEVTLVNIHRGEVLEEKDLPLKYVAYSPCFRREAGAYGRATRGFLRVHQFNKVELVRFELPDKSYEALEELVGEAEKPLAKLELPYRVVKLCAGDLGFAAAATYDLEVWAPATGKWLEVSSCSNCEDFQARRGNIRYKPFRGGSPRYLHTLNGSGVATSRLMVSLLEHYQTDEGTWEVPVALRPYLGGRTYISRSC
ncbi:MAG: serine--tRNA ligase, partial [bacterium]